MTDNINPSHYAEGWSNGAEVIDIAENLTLNGGAALQYIARSTRVDGNNKGDAVEDLFKAQWYLTREIQRITQDDNFFVDHMTAEIVPRVWESLADIPEGVMVLDSGGVFWVNESGLLYFDLHGNDRWVEAWTPTIQETNDSLSPFTEVLEDK